MASDPGKIELEPEYRRFLEDAKQVIITAYDGDDRHPMHDPFSLAWRASQCEQPVLLTGETGTGKELFAKIIHRNSKTRSRSFVTFDCGGQAESLIQSTLFGHTRGAFTGAINNRDGLFKEADGGTISIDEIGSAPSSVQAALIRVTQSGEIQRVGSATLEKVHVRIISATNIDLKQACKTGEFRDDLFYRLAGLLIHIPPLCERGDDLLHLLAKFWLDAKMSGVTIRYLSFNTMAFLINYGWLGNVRELQHMIESAAIICTGEILQFSEFAKPFKDDFDEEIVRESWQKILEYAKKHPTLKCLGRPGQEEVFVQSRYDLWREFTSMIIADYIQSWNSNDWGNPSKFFEDYPETKEFIDAVPIKEQRFTFEEADQQLRFDMHKLCESVGMGFELQKIQIRRNGRPKRGGGKLPPHAQQAIIESFKKNKSISKVHDELGFDTKTIRKYLRQHDILPSD